MGFPNYDFSDISSFGNPDSGISKVDIHEDDNVNVLLVRDTFG